MNHLAVLERMRLRRARTESDVRQLIRDVDHWNRIHPTDPPIAVDDEQGSLAAACRLVGLDLPALEHEERLVS